MLQSMTDVTTKNFGYLIAYLLPGFSILVVLSDHSPILQQWLALSVDEAPTVGGFFYITLASLATGLALNSLRAFTLDRALHATGIRQPQWSFARLTKNLDAFEAVIENHYRYFQFHGNMAYAFIIAIMSPSRLLSLIPGSPVIVIAVAVGVAVLFLVGARHSLKRSYERSEDVLSQTK